MDLLKCNSIGYTSPLLQDAIDEVFKETSPAQKRSHASDTDEDAPTQANKQIVRENSASPSQDILLNSIQDNDVNMENA